MSTAVEEAVMTPRESAEFYIPLVKEYAEKLSAIGERASNLLQAAVRVGTEPLIPEAVRLIETFECLRPVVAQLIQRSATILDLADLGRDYELALALRQEELEAQFRLTPLVLGQLETSLGTKQIRATIDKSRVKVVG